MTKKSYSLRDKALFINYERILKNYGKTAKYIPKRQIFTEAGDTMFLAFVTARRIIIRMLKDGYCPSDLDISEVDKMRNPDKVLENIK